MELTIRTGRPGDEDAILALLHELAEYEKLADKFQLTREIVARDFLRPNPACCSALAFLGEEAVGVITWFPTYASFSAVRQIHLEDLYLQPSRRGKGHGKKMLAWLAKHALATGAAGISWFVLDWNKPSIAFYDSLRAEPATGWLSYSLTGDALEDLADQA
jgi:GNAT superfamily N-acetyltransferase